MQRLSPLDAMFLHQDHPEAPRQVASLAIITPGERPLDYDRLIQVINERIDLVPRYRQVPRRVPGGIGMPVWVDDEHFDLSLHVRRSALPRPGGRDALHELVGRLIARRLDHERPLWELYLIEGLQGGELALLFKSHQALVDGSHTVDLAQVLLEETQRDRTIPHEEWTPRSAPGAIELVAGSVRSQLNRPSEVLWSGEYQWSRLTSKLPVLGPDSATHGPLVSSLSRHRRFTTVSAPLSDFRRVRDEHGGTVNDVILAAIAGGLRGWMLTRAEPVTAKTGFRAMVPMSVTRDGPAGDGLPTSLGPRVRGLMLTLPVGESNAVVRLHQVSYALKGHREMGSAVAANKMASLPGFATSTFHAVGARVAADESHRPYHLVITNVPGPQDPVYMAGQQLQEIYPAIPLTGHRTISVGVTSYDGHVYFGVVTDREAVPDADVLGQCILEALEELTETIGPRRTRAPRGRKRPT
ncbi:wax ester/triacylglycerol synthase family O-acyltransferase [Aeromicrobium senzhongii]|uniref:Diacylglycerol O-acyltransferase n=1 Tax=Aeromicrobium senzhongii TaxID=2663859 RepID=A0ABX6SVR0_9ACTN|nr:wax ester/triacylglycerol synthase family O-acyltransferase [Aeromicrobium senzhongii]MTB87788.1 wax ester/triacylglycerol synthase family O-acyltransferase [Aeromicrobium senzhongii]QNL95188.1 wax ester/triacylglycerol synthase family O-acyltransferase [Aeromicrobium senzhongii]